MSIFILFLFVCMYLFVYYLFVWYRVFIYNPFWPGIQDLPGPSPKISGMHYHTFIIILLRIKPKASCMRDSPSSLLVLFHINIFVSMWSNGFHCIFIRVHHYTLFLFDIAPTGTFPHVPSPSCRPISSLIIVCLSAFIL